MTISTKSYWNSEHENRVEGFCKTKKCYLCTNNNIAKYRT